MSVQFGRWNFEGQPPAPDYIEKVSATLAPYGPDSNESYSEGGIKILYCAFHTTKESHREKQPCISPSGTVVTWDGRLDNRAELVSELRNCLTINSTDAAIVAAAYEKWEANCLGKLIGDWALSIWNPRERSVLLAKDPIGTRHLYYALDDKQLTWSTILDPLVLFAGKSFEICEEYIAGWLAIPAFPAAHLTPYVGIHSVPPSSSVLLQPARHIVGKYWDFDPGKRIRYRADDEYEEHFRSALATAVQRRLRSDRPVLAELSGGMDSSSIVCTADTIIPRDNMECPRLDTISWFDDSCDYLEPDSNELRWISEVENKRKRAGFHINTRGLLEGANGASSGKSFGSVFDSNRLAVVPIPNNGQSEFVKRYRAYVQTQGYRVTLSGIGGDEATGSGVPTPAPELQNLLARGRFLRLARQLNAWAAKMKKPRLPLLWEAAQGFFSAQVDIPRDLRLGPWFFPSFVSRNRAALCGYPFRVKLFGALPSFQDHLDKLEANRRFVGHFSLCSELLRDVRYPYYDRDFLDFIYAIPREQIVRVGQRRSLMKRAMVGIVPNELLHRRRKIFAPPQPKKDISTEWPSLSDLGQSIIASSVGIIDPDRFAEALHKARCNETVLIGSLKRTLTLESWLRHLTIQGVLTNRTLTERNDASPEATERQASTQSKILAS
jgi:asparagine synthase (glutamine-hydrolysing)